jgi:hypothetical protein
MLQARLAALSPAERKALAAGAQLMLRLAADI